MPLVSRRSAPRLREPLDTLCEMAWRGPQPLRTLFQLTNKARVTQLTFSQAYIPNLLASSAPTARQDMDEHDCAGAQRHRRNSKPQQKASMGAFALNRRDFLSAAPTSIAATALAPPRDLAARLKTSLQLTGSLADIVVARLPSISDSLHYMPCQQGRHADQLVAQAPSGRPARAVALLDPELDGQFDFTLIYWRIGDFAVRGYAEGSRPALLLINDARLAGMHHLRLVR